MAWRHASGKSLTWRERTLRPALAAKRAVRTLSQAPYCQRIVWCWAPECRLAPCMIVHTSPSTGSRSGGRHRAAQAGAQRWIFPALRDPDLEVKSGRVCTRQEEEEHAGLAPGNAPSTLARDSGSFPSLSWYSTCATCSTRALSPRTASAFGKTAISSGPAQTAMSTGLARKCWLSRASVWDRKA